MEAYCMKCKAKREMDAPKAVFTKSGTPATSGICPECGTKMFKMGRTEAHEGLTPPPPSERKRKKKTPKRSGKLVIVESPAKARTVGRFLGKGYNVQASVGHVRDLLRSQLSVDVEGDFSPKYRVPNDKRPVVKELKAAAKKAETVYLATDPDREGEAIAWHLIEAAEIEPERSQRVVFHEITRDAVDDAFSHPREIDMGLVDAQQARRVLDRLVGYSISPILWRKVRNRLSAGRVQSVALRLIAEREVEVENFIPEEYWSIKAELLPEGGKQSYLANLTRINGEKPVLNSQEIVDPILADMKAAEYSVEAVKRGTRQRKAPAPFTTSTLQQDASRKLNYTAKRTMALAQQLYEGIDMGDGEPVGLITYMRTDSTNISKQAQEEVREYITEKLGGKFLPDEAPVHKTRAKRAEEAHEAVRPTSAFREPKELKPLLTNDQYRLYNLIWRRFVASQMNPAIYDTLSVRIIGNSDDNTYNLRASASQIKFKGYLSIYEESKPITEKKENGDMDKIPAGLEEGQNQELKELLPEQHFTQPPPRYSEASLVRKLEELGIGRPSTYAPILNTLNQRGYVYREERRLNPTETGIVVNDLLVEHFPNIVDTGFTAGMEGDLDKIADGGQDWKNIIKEFYLPFAEQVAEAEAKMPEVKAEPEKIGRDCPKCGEDLIIRWGRFGKFISCSGFPNCRHTEPFLEKIGVTCPDDGGDVVSRKTRKGRIFYGCANYPECEFRSWKKPIVSKCPQCEGTLVIASKREVQCLACETKFLREEVEPVVEAED